MNGFANQPPLTLGFLTIADASPPQTIAAAKAGGFQGVSLRVTGRRVGDPWFDVLGNPDTLTAMQQTLRTLGMRLSNLSAYYLDGNTRAQDYQPVFEIAQQLGAPLMVQGCFDPDRARLVDTLRQQCQLANRYGIRIGIEFMPASPLKTLDQALSVVREVAAPNLGLVIDALHLARSGGSPSAISALDPASIYLVQICDAPARKPDDVDLMTEALQGRFYPGEGELPLAALMAAIPPDVEIECEVPKLADRHLDFAERTTRAYQATRKFLQTLPATASSPR
ncbi:MAG: sugar phosphate isomerase/epimerase family protein [Janthinobacterium lividum]